MAYFPLFIDLENKNILVAGGGRIAARRIRVLLEFGARLTVVAPEMSDEIAELASESDGGSVTLINREYESGDMQGRVLALAATDRRKINHQVFLDAKASGIPVNVCDKKEECSFYFPGIAKRGELVAGITAGGGDHGLAKRASSEVRKLFAEF